MKYFMKKVIFCLLITFIFNSCLGLSMDLHMKRDGSARLTMEYQIPILLLNLGGLDGNQNWPAVPVGQADFERSLARIEGAKLVSFSSREKGQDYFINVTVDFDNTESLVKLIGESNSISNNNLNLFIVDGSDVQDIEPLIIQLLKSMSEDKKLSLSFTKDGSSSSLKVTDSRGNEIQPSGTTFQIVPSGRKVSFSIDSMDILDFKDGLELKISW